MAKRLFPDWRGLRAALVATFALAAAAATQAADRLVLWRIVHDQCVPDEKANGSPAPCETVDISDGEDNGVAILKDLVGIAQFLAIPTRRITGIELPEILAPSAPNYWRAAWTARGAMERRLARPLSRDMIGMAINSAQARSQDQLHIHIDCLAPEVRQTLAAHRAELTQDWRPLSTELKGRRYIARRLDSSDLAGADPFRLLGEEGAASAMAMETLVVAGENFPGQEGFVLLAGRADPSVGDIAHREDLLDHSCAVAELGGSRQ